MNSSSTYINLRVDGMSRHGKVDASGVSRSINVVCTCVRAWNIEKLEKRQIALWIYEDTSSEPREKFGSIDRGQEATVYIPPAVFCQAWDTAIFDDIDNRQVNLRVLIDDEGTDHLSVISYSLDEVRKLKSDQPSNASSLTDKINRVLLVGLVIYGAYGIANYLKLF